MGKKSKNQRTQDSAKIPDIQMTPAFSKESQSLWIAVALLMSFVAFIPALGAEFVNWDDQDYAINNILIRDFSNFTKFFTTPVQGNFHPLTMISLALNYAISGSNPFSYHLFNVLLHLANVYLVYRFIFCLSNSNTFIAFSVALLFGVHPMHVESVAWVSERKDVLYTLFFIPGLSFYIEYLDKDSKKAYWLSFLMFALSILSKPAAIIFPAVLLTLDFYKARPLSIKWILDKIPFGLVALVFLYLTMHAQTTAGATPTSEFYGWGKRIFFPFYGYMMYLYKLVLPVNLTAFYPLPPINENLAAPYLFSPLVFAATAWLCLKTWRRYREISFGFLFYLTNLALVLQLFMFGSAIISERYTYVPYIGIFYVLAWYLYQRSGQNLNKRYYLVTGVGLVLMLLSFFHAQSWKNTAALWDNAIKSYPGAKAYTNRAYLFQQAGQLDKALDLYLKSLKYNVLDEEVYYNMGVIYYNQNKDSMALLSYNKALEYKDLYPDALNGRGSVYARMNLADKAFADFNRCIELKPDYALAYKNRASSYFLQNKYDSAIADFKRYNSLQDKDSEGYSNLCVAYLNKGSNQEAIQACEQAIKMDPKFAKPYTNIGAAYINLNEYGKAIEYLRKSFQLDSLSEENLKFLSLAYLKSGDTTQAYSVFEYAQRMRDLINKK